MRHGWTARSLAAPMIGLALAAGSGGLGLAQDSWSQGLALDANDPTAPLRSFQLQDSYSGSVYNSGGASQNVLQFRAVIPLELGGLQNLLRVTLPYVTTGPGGTTGLADSTLSDLVTFDQAWGRIGVGAAALLPTGTSGLSAEKWALGPAAGFTARSGDFIWGVFNQNLFSFAGSSSMPDVALSTLQPVATMGLKNGWSLGVSDMTMTYDWDRGDWVSLPVGVKMGKLVQVGAVPLQISGAYERNFASAYPVPKDQFSLAVKVLLP